MKIAIVFGGISFEHEISIVKFNCYERCIKWWINLSILDSSRDMYQSQQILLNQNF